MTTTTTWDVVVIGGGLAGLAAGAEVTAGGGRALVLDAHRPGGRARVTTKEGYTLNHGAHALYLGGPGIAVLRRHGIEPDGVAPPLAAYKMSIGGVLHRYPVGPGSLLRTGALSLRGKAQLGRLLGTLPRLRADSLAGTSVSAFLDGYDLRPDARTVVGAVLRQTTYGADFDDLDAGAAVAQLQSAARHGVTYLHGGWGQLIDGLAARTHVRTGSKVRALHPVAGQVEVVTDDGVETAGAVVVATGNPQGARALLPDAPDWGELGPPVTAACLDLGLPSVPTPGWVLGGDEPVYCTLQSPPARMAPEGCSVAGVIRYGARSADIDRADLEAHARLSGIDPDTAIVRRFLARMVVAGTQPRAVLGGLAGRPAVTATGHPAITLAGGWVGSEGMLADASLASGAAAARRALAAAARSAKMPV